ncbi:unnamed protein product [Parnassius mnemosyne]|uniref:Uncharacterized protein n=1 Tax=Parnassius mnemosyne TaxID=213953 RepID=A0AAV1KKN5_9NEOP
MLRYFYLLSFLLYFQLIFCYDYLNNDALDHQYRSVNGYENRNTNKHPKLHKKKMHRKRQEYKFLDTEPIAQFDLASFIQGPDNIAERNGLYGDSARKRRLPSKDYSEYESIKNLNTDDKLHDKWDEYMDSAQENSAEANEKYMPLKELQNHKDADEIGKVNSQHNQENIYKNMYQDEKSLIHYQQKKGALQNFRFPFFSHKKPDTLKSTKNKKRKTALSNSSKIEKPKELITVNGQILNVDREMLVNADSPYNFKINKRSYIERLCPKCKRKYIDSLKSLPRIRRVSSNIIHNSRQFYQNTKEAGGISNNKNSSGNKENLTISPEVRYKRQQSNEDKERQMKELEEVERKIDSVEINSYAFQKIKSSTASIKL